MEPVCANGQRKSQWLTVVVWLVMGLTVVLSARQTQARDGSIRAVIQLILRSEALLCRVVQKPLATYEFVMHDGRTCVFFELPPRKLCVLHVYGR